MGLFYYEGIELMNLMKTSLLDAFAKNRIFLFLVIIFVNLSIFYPSFFHTARGGDHLYFLIETAQYDNFTTLFKNTYSFTRTRTLAAGDNLLFRPLLYGFLSLEKSLFGYNFMWWQFVGFILHLLVLWQIFKIVNMYMSMWFSFFLVLFFSTLFISSEMVIWHHLSSYLLFFVIFLEGFYWFIKYIQSDFQQDIHLGLSILLISISCFFYEIGIILSGIMWGGLIILKLLLPGNQVKLKIRSIFLYLIPIVFFGLVNLIDFLVQGKQWVGQAVAGGYESGQKLFSVLFHYLNEICYLCVGSLLFPSILNIREGERSRLMGFEWGNICDVSQVEIMLNMFAILLFCVGLVVVLRSFFKRVMGKNQVKKDQLILLMLSLINFIFVGIFIVGIILGRLATAPLYLMYSLYDFYIMYVFCLLGGIFLIKFLSEKYQFLGVKSIKNVLVLGLVLLTLVNCVKVYQFNLSLKMISEPYRKYQVSLDAFFREHKEEQDFSFLVVSSQYQSICNIYEEGKGGSVGQIFLMNALYKSYINNENPKYWLVYSGQKGLTSFSNKVEAKQYADSLMEGKFTKIYTNEIQ